MGYPTQAELLTAEPLVEWIDAHFLRADPYAFRGSTGFRPVVALISTTLDVDANGVFCIGSGAIGLSLNPAKVTDARLKSFDVDSDLDLAIVSEVHFETAWRDLRRATQAVLDEIPFELTEHLDWQRKRFFDGAIVAHNLLPFLSFGSVWLANLVRLSEGVAVLLDREVQINVWIYRDYWSLRNYVATSIVRCRARMV